MKCYYVLLFLVLIVFSTEEGFCQPAEITYAGSVAKSGSINNAFYGPFNIGFNFTFFGNTYNQFFVSSNGLVSFGEGYDYPLNYTIPDATVIEGVSVPNNYIAPFWDDLTIDASGNILYATVGAAPNRKLIVQFRNMGFYGGPVYMGTFSVILFEGTGVIQTQYRIVVLESATKPHGESATIGLENIDGSVGSLYSFNNPAAITSRQAISFTPNAGNYSINSNAVYEGVYLTTNLTLPEPGITTLISPAENGTIGTNHTFQWSASSNAVSYSLKISTNSSLSGAVSYNAGSDLSYNITGLIPGTTYYWGVFATNSTGTTWGEVKKFVVSSSPPLAAVPQTIWVEQLQDKTIKLNYTGGEVGAKTAVITSLPAHGKLYQYNAGTKGSEITSILTTVSDANMNVIYEASGISGNGVGNFNFRINDAGGDSPVVTTTVNVSPPGVPEVLYVAKNSNSVEIQFDIPMTDPAGKHNQFTVTVNSLPVTVNSASLKAGDPNSILLTLASPLSGVENVTVSYTQGDVTGSTGGFLFSFTDQPVTLLSQIITFIQVLEKKYSDSPFTLTASATSGLGMTYSSSNLSLVTAVGSVLTFHSLGISVITARQSGDATYAPARYARPLTVSIGDQTITFNALAPKNASDPDFNPGATASSGLPVSYTSSESAVATILSGMIHIVGEGTSVITASQAGNSLYNGAIPVQRTLTVGSGNKTLNLTSVMLQGLYVNSTTMRQAYDESGPHYAAGIADHVTIELHSSENYSTIVYASTNVPLSTGGSISVSIPAIYNSNYYITVKHRNSLETVSATAKSFSGSIINQSFGAPAEVFGGNLKVMTGGYAIYAGEQNQDGLLDGSDLLLVNKQVTKASAGYLVEDINGDGLTDGSDLNMLIKNVTLAIGSITP
jgi:hypothetical protein